MELRHLDQIVAICRAGSFSVAAKALGTADAEQEHRPAGGKLGVLLFERTNANARPTVYGQFVADHAAS